MSGLLNSHRLAAVGGGVSPMNFISAAVSNPSSAIIPKVSAVVGNLAVILVGNIASGARLVTEGGREWNRHQLSWAAHGYISILFWQFLDSQDVAPQATGNRWLMRNSTLGSTVTVTEMEIGIYDPNGGTLLTVKDTTANLTGQSDLTLAGFVKDSASRGVVSLFLDRDFEKTPTVPSGFTSRVSAKPTVGNYILAIADNLSGYVDSADAVWTGVNGANGFAEAGFLLEVT